jgi:hypothetical protein
VNLIRDARGDAQACGGVLRLADLAHELGVGGPEADLIQEGGDDAAFGSEAGVDGLNGDTCALGDRADGGGLITAFEQHRASSVGDLPAGEIGLRLAGGRGVAT